MNKSVILGDINFQNDAPFVLIAGPCVLESYGHANMMCSKLLQIASELKIQLIYKTSYDKANRTSISSDRGLGIDKSIEIFDKLKKEFNVPIITDVHSVLECNQVKDHVDIIQIPAFLCRQTDLLIAAANTNKIINVKKGQFLAPRDMINVVNKITDSGNENILLTERGACFGYNNLVSDMRSLEIMKDEIGFPVIFDATHSIQSPGGMGNKSGGDSKYAPILARAAAAVGVAGIFIETHDNPDKAPSDGPNMIKLDEMSKILKKLIEIDNLVKEK